MTTPPAKQIPNRSPTPAAATARLLELCALQGFALAGVAPAAPSRWSGELRAWLDAGRHGLMDYLERDHNLRIEPGGLFPGTRSFLMVADQYALRGDATDVDLPPGKGRIARYARGRDYHDTMKRRLHNVADQMRIDFPGSGFRSFVDTVPVLERELAAACGIGWQGKNTMIINPVRGSYLLLGGAACTLDLEPPPPQRPVQDACGTCTRCIDACPTKAITPYSVDATRCVSYLTIERRTTLDPALFPAIGEWLYGCDICQEVCPHNSAAWSGRGSERPVGDVHHSYFPYRDSFDLLEVLGWDVDARRQAFKTTAMKRITLEMVKRNALIVAGNWLKEHDLPDLRARILACANDESESAMVRETALAVASEMAR